MIAGYGTRKGNLEEILERQAARMRARGIANVYIGYFRVSSPSIPEALEQMVADGVDDVLVMPYYIAEGRLTYELIPGKLGISGNVGTVDVKGKNVKVRMAPAFGNIPALADIVCDRVADAGGDFDDGVMVIGHGSRDSVSSNKDIMEMNADRLRRSAAQRSGPPTSSAGHLRRSSSTLLPDPPDKRHPAPWSPRRLAAAPARR